MSTSTRNLILGILAGVAGIIALLVTYFTAIVPNPLPSPSPSVIISATPLPSASAIPSPSPSLALPPPNPSPLPSVSPSTSTKPIPSPTVSPSPSPSVVASPTVSPTAMSNVMALQGAAQKPFPGVQLTWGANAILKGSRNEIVTAMFQNSGPGCLPLVAPAISGISASFFTIGSLTTIKPSYIGAPLGAQYDIMMPTSQFCTGDLAWADILIGKTVAPGQYSFSIAGTPISLTVYKMTMPDSPTHPIYMEINGGALLAGHKLDPNSSVAVQAPLTQLYINMARAHRIEPYKQRVADPQPQADGTLNIDNYSQYGGSFRQLVLTGNISPPMLDPQFAQSQLTPAMVTAIGKLAATLPSSWAYMMDEPNTPALVTDMQARATLFRQYAPNVKLMVTIEDQPSLESGVDIFCPHDLLFKQPGHPQVYRPGYWMYGSCMNHGSCADGTSSAPGTLPGPPDLLVDLPMVHPRAYAWVNATLGAQASIYYSTVEGYDHYGVFKDSWTDQYIFSGNGDGTLFYPGRTGEHGFTADQPVASLRLKAIRQSSYDIEYITMAKAAGIAFVNPVTDALHWSKSYNDYEAVRTLLGDALNAK